MITGISRFTKGEFSQASLDEVYDKGKELYKDDPTTQPPPPASGIIENSGEMMWADMNDPNTGWVSNMQWMNQFKGPSRKDVATSGVYTDFNLWIEIEAGGDGSPCSLDMNRAVNTRVEFGWTRGYMLLDDNTWVMFGESENQELDEGNGGQYPYPGKDETGYFGSRRGCSEEIDQIVYDSWEEGFPIPGFSRIEASNLKSIKPSHYSRWHGWAKNFIAPDYTRVIGVAGHTYTRLIVEDSTKLDDRHLANYVVHIASDIYNRDLPQKDQYMGDLGISRYKQVVNDWTPVNFLSCPSSMTRDQFLANLPPFPTTPY